MFAARCYLPQKYFAIRQRTINNEIKALDVLPGNPKCKMMSCWMASLEFVYGLLLGNCGYQTDRKIYDQSVIAWSGRCARDKIIYIESLLEKVSESLWYGYKQGSKTDLTYKQFGFRSIVHFRVPKTLAFKMRRSAQPFLWKWVLFAWE